MKRKVVLHGTTTLIVSLPSKWVKKYNVKKGDEIEVEEEANKLIISTDKAVNLSSTEIDVTGLDRTSLMYTIRSLYRKGYDEINIKWTNPLTRYNRLSQNVKVISVIHQEVNRLVGVEIIQEKEDMCTIKDLQQVDLREFENILRKIFLLIQNGFETLVKGIKNNDTILLDTIEEKHDTITKFVSYCLRIMNKKGYIEPKNTLYVYHIIATLDRITDNIKYCARETVLENTTFSSEGVRLFEQIAKSFTNYYEFFYKFDNDYITRMSTTREDVAKDIAKYKKSFKEEELMLIKYMYVTLEMLLDLTEARMGIEY